MPTVMRADGIDFDVDQFLENSTLTPCQVFRRHSPKFPGSKSISKTSGFNVDVSEGDFDEIEKQIKDSIYFLTKNKEEIAKLKKYAEVESLTLDFGVIQSKDSIIQSIIFPNDLLQLIAEFGLQLEVSWYPIANVES